MRFIGGRPTSAHALLPDVLAPTYNGETSIAACMVLHNFMLLEGEEIVQVCPLFFF